MVLRTRSDRRPDHSVSDCVDTTLNILGITPARTNTVTRGLHYSLTPSSPHMRRCVASVNPSLPDDLPQIDVSHVFTNPNNTPILSTIISVDRYRFLILGYLDFELPQNPNLHEFFPHLPWHGELVVFSMGRRVRVLSRPLGARYVVQKAISVFIRAVIEAHLATRPLPTQIAFNSQSVFVV